MLWVDVLPVSPLQAATEGRVLILEGIEKAERNVLPVLNNLLENREMQVGAPLTVCMYGLHVFRVSKYYYSYIITIIWMMGLWQQSCRARVLWACPAAVDP